jgi:hypothetical protein
LTRLEKPVIINTYTNKEQTMQRDYDTLATFEREGFDVIVDKTYEDLSPRDQFEEEDVAEIIAKINDYTYDWFMLRVRVMAEGVELGSAYLGGCLYEDAKEVLTDGTAEDMIYEAMAEAKAHVYKVYKKFAELNEAIEREGVEV